MNKTPSENDGKKQNVVDKVSSELRGDGDPFDGGAETPRSDYERNRSGVYGGRPEVRGYDQTAEEKNKETKHNKRWDEVSTD